MRLPLILALLASLIPGARADISGDLRTFAGSPARMVWARSVHPAHKDTFLERAEHVLVGLDTEDGAGIRVIRDERSSYRKPLLTPDGKGVVYSQNVEGKCYYVGFDGSGHRPLADGLAASIVPHPEGGSPWVYAIRGPLPWTAQPAAPGIFRFRLDSPDQQEDVWSTQPVSLDNLQIARDGKTFSGLFPWPYAGVGDFDTGRWTQFTRGCWPSISPGGEVLWVFGGAHQSVSMFSRDPEHRWEVSVNDHPKLAGTEVYHPRWSNHPRLFALTGPYSRDAGNMMAVFGGGDQVEVFAGRFSEDLGKVEEWLQITDDKAADFGPDLWVQGAEGQSLDIAKVTAGKPAGGGMASLAKAGWTADRRELCVLWDNGNAQNEVTIDGKPIASRLTLGDRATYGRHHELLAGGGYASAEPELAAHLAARCRETDQFTIELVFNSYHPQNDGAGIIASLGDAGGGTSLLLLENAGSLYLSTRGGMNSPKPDGPITLMAMPKRKLTHLILRSQPGELAIFLDGQSAGRVPGFRSDLSGWQADRLNLGASPGADADWHGSIEKFALYARALDDAEIFSKAEVIKTDLAARPSVKHYRASGKLEAVSPVPGKDDLGAYRRGLVLYTYALEGKSSELLEAEKITVAHWAVLDQQPLPGYPREVGQSYPLHLEPMAAHPELKPEWTAAAPDPLLPVFFDAFPPALLSPETP